MLRLLNDLQERTTSVDRPPANIVGRDVPADFGNHMECRAERILLSPFPRSGTELGAVGTLHCADQVWRQGTGIVSLGEHETGSDGLTQDRAEPCDLEVEQDDI